MNREVSVASSIWIDSLGRCFADGLDLMAAAIRDCSDALWESPMWAVPAGDLIAELVAADGRAVTDAGERLALVQRFATPWAVAWHALECLDYDLTGEFGPWSPPHPFAGHPHWRLTGMASAWSRSEMLGYVDHCRSRVQSVLAEMTEESAARLLPEAHRYRGRPHGWLLMVIMGHTIEHASQIRQFVSDRLQRPALSAT